MLFCEVSYANIAYRYMLVGIQVVAIPSIVIAYAIDSYKSLPGEVSTYSALLLQFFRSFGMRHGYDCCLLFKKDK